MENKKNIIESGVLKGDNSQFSILNSQFKKTDIGLIPEDWELKTFEEVMDGFSSGQTPFRGIKEYYTGNILWITSGELNYNIIYDTIEKITQDAVKAANLKIIPKGTFLFAITGLEAAGTRGRCAITGKEATTNQSCMALYPKKNLLTTEYLYQYYKRYGNELAFIYCQGTKQQSYTAKIAKILPIILPPLPEQHRIAEVLTDTDNLISGLEKLIEKKKNIKKGTLQKLLKPQEDWKTVKLGEICNYQNGTSLEKFFNNESGFKVISIGNYSPEGKYVENSNFIDKKYETNIKKFILKKDDLTMILNDKTAVGTIIGRVLFIDKNSTYVFNQRTMKLSSKSSVSSLFLYHLINSDFIHNQFAGIAKPGTQIYINTNDVIDFEISIPLIEKQIEIAEILTDIDNEIEKLEMKLEKYRQLKQGFMQELLTGKTRLVENFFNL